MWRPSPALRIAAVLFALASLVFAVWVVGVAAEEGVWWQGVAFAVVLVIFPATLGLRYALRTRIELRTDALAVVTTFSEHHFEWVDIEDAAAGYAGITLLLRDGTTFLAGAVQKPNASSWLKRPSRADVLVAEITARARATR